MNKYMLFGVLMGWLIIATFIITSARNYLDNDDFDINNPIGDISSDGEGRVEQSYSMIGTFFSAITFQVVGLPNIVAMIMFQVPVFIMMYMLIEVLIHLVPFT